MPFKSKSQRRWMYANKPEMAREFEAHTPKNASLPEKVGKMIRVDEADLVGKMKGPLKTIDECGKCKSTMVGKHCGCEDGKKVKRKLPMIGKADENFDALPLDLQRLISQLPLEMQATQLGGAGSTDIRPTMDEMNYEMPSRHIGLCGTCDHSVRHDGILTCRALKLDPPVSPAAHCDLWVGGRHMVGKVRNGAGPTIPYGEQTMPDYELIYHVTPRKETAKRERRMADERRRASAERNSGRYGFHGEAPNPVITMTPDKYPMVVMPKMPTKFKTKPLIQAPVIQTRHNPESNRERLLFMPRQRSADMQTFDVPRKLKKGERRG